MRLPMPGGTQQKLINAAFQIVRSFSLTARLVIDRRAGICSGYTSFDPDYRSSYSERSLSTGSRQREGDRTDLSTRIERSTEGL